MHCNSDSLDNDHLFDEFHGTAIRLVLAAFITDYWQFLLEEEEYAR